MPVISIPDTIHDDTDHFPVDTIFSHAGCDMGMVVLDPDQRDLIFIRCQIFCKAGRQVIGVQVAGYQRRFKPEQAAETADRFGIEFQCFEIFQVADVLAHNGLLSFANTKTVHQFGTGGKNPFRVKRQVHRGRGETPGSPD